MVVPCLTHSGMATAAATTLSFFTAVFSSTARRQWQQSPFFRLLAWQQCREQSSCATIHHTLSRFTGSTEQNNHTRPSGNGTSSIPQPLSVFPKCLTRNRPNGHLLSVPPFFTYRSRCVFCFPTTQKNLDINDAILLTEHLPCHLKMNKK